MRNTNMPSNYAGRADVDKVFDGYNANHPDAITVATVIKMAIDRGYEISHAAADPAKIGGFSSGLPEAVGDVANGRVFADAHRGRFIYVPEVDAWHRFDPETGWLSALPGDVDRAAKDVANLMLDRAVAEIKADPDSKTAAKLLQRAQKVHNLQPMKAMIEMAKSESEMSCPAADFDSDPMQLGVPNGVIDLNSGRLLAASPAIRVSKRCAVVYDPEAGCSRFEQFLQEVLPDSDVRAFIQRWIGYCLTGRSTEKKLLMLIGAGDNGKSVLIEIINWLLGTYATKIETEMLMRHIRSPQGASPDIVALKGMRLAFANETSEGQRLDDARVKALTGGDTLTGRVPYGKSAITFEPTHKLMIAGNHKPVITDTSGGMWGRVVLIPFDVVIPPGQRDRHLLDKLKQEGSGILNWALAGLADYLANGLNVPLCLTAATQVYRDEQDMIGEWITDH